MKEIEKDIPIFSHGNRRYDFSAMEVGDSCQLEYPKLRYAVFSALRWYNTQNNTQIRIKTRKDGDTVRFWRIA